MTADRNLLFGILALQMDFIGRDALVGAMNAWVLDKQKPLGQILVERGALDGDAHLLLEALVQKHLKMHGGDPQKSLASVAAILPVHEGLQKIADPDVQASLSVVEATRPPSLGTVTGNSVETDPYATLPPSASVSPGLRFRILRPHAKGGLGEVFVARDEELGREVALKQIQEQHADDRDSRSRFVLEAEITGNLEHPGIVPVYGMCTTPDGRPNYAMKFIRGASLQAAVSRFHETEGAGRDSGQRALELRKLLRRFIDACNAVAYAHSRGVLHRDLKPDNVMLGAYGETLVVDWGLAKVAEAPAGAEPSAEGKLRPTSADSSAATQMGSIMGTPHYMSPEQAAGRLDLLGPASDVYSLGATLYCLLAGKAPFEGRDLCQILLEVQTGEFPRPRQVKAGVPVALEAVCLKAMALNPKDRYISAQELANEVERWLADEPVTAYREPWMVRAGRWVRRHRTKVTAAVAAIAAAAVCLAVATVLLAEANRREREANLREREANEEVSRERDEVSKQNERADRNLAKARKTVEDYCTNVAEDKRLKQADLHALRKKLLETAVPFYEEFVQQKGDDPKLQADRGKAFYRLAFLRAEMGDTDQALADYRQMQVIFAELVKDFPAVPEYRQSLGRSHNRLGVCLAVKGQSREAEAAHRQSLAIREKLVKDFPAVPDYREDLAATYFTLGFLRYGEGQSKEAEAFYRQALAIEEKLAHDFPAVPDYRWGLAADCDNLGILLYRRGQFKEAEVVYRQGLAIREKLVKDFPAVPDYRQSLAKSHTNLGLLLKDRGQSKEAESAYRQAVLIKDKLALDFPAVPDYRKDLAISQINLGQLLAGRGQSREAEAVYRQVLAIGEKLAHDFPAVPDYRQDLAKIHSRLGMLLSARGQSKEAEAVYRQALAIQEKLAHDFPAVPDYRMELAFSHITLGGLLDTKGQLKEAEACYQQALAIREKLARDFPTVPNYRRDLGYSYQSLGYQFSRTQRQAQAEEAYGKALDIREKLVGDFPVVPSYRQDLGYSYQRLGYQFSRKKRPAEAAEAYRKALAIREKLVTDFPLVPSYRQDLAQTFHNLGLLWAGNSADERPTVSLADGSERKKKLADAVAAYRRSLDIREKLAKAFPAVPSYREDLAWSHNNLGFVLAQMGKASEAEAAYRQALGISEKLVKDFSAIQGYSLQLGLICTNVGNLTRDGGRTEAALEWYGRAIDTLQTAFGPSPKTTDSRRYLSNAHRGRAGALSKLLRHADAVKDWDRAIELTKESNRPRLQLRRDLSQALAGKGDLGKTVTEAVALSERKGEAAMAVYDAACVCALASASVKDAKLVDQYAVRAVELLTKARDGRFFQDRTKLERMKKDSDLDSLRSRDDYKKLLAELEKGDKSN